MKIPQSYRHTTVHWGKSQSDIMKLLLKFGIRDVRFTMLESRNEIICEFNYPTEIDGKTINFGVRVQIPIPDMGREKNKERVKNQTHRALFYYLKTKFEALSFGIVEFVQEFLPHLVMLDKQGRSATVYQMIGEQVKQGYITGKQEGVLLLEGPREERKKR